MKYRSVSPYEISPKYQDVHYLELDVLKPLTSIQADTTIFTGNDYTLFPLLAYKILLMYAQRQRIYCYLRFIFY